MLKRILSYITSSIKDPSNKVSSTRIQSYLLVTVIYIFALFFIINEGIMLYHSIKLEVDYNISSQFMIAFSSLLSHHLLLLGINKNSKAEPKYSEVPKK